MRFGTMLWDVLGSLLRKPATRKYPFERSTPPERLRGKLTWDPAKCTGCGLCAKDCPSDALEVITIDRASKKFVVRYHVDRCTFCAQCVQNCRFKCMSMTNSDWELAALKKQAFTIHYGSEADLEAFLKQWDAQPTETPAG